MATKEFPLSLVIRAIDKATAPLRAVNEKIQKFTAPVRKLSNSFRALSNEAGLPRMVEGFRGVGKSVASVGRETVALGLKVAALAAGAGFAFFSVVKGAVDAGDKLGEMSQRVGLGVDAYAQLQYAAAQADVDQEQFNGSMDVFNKQLGQAKAGGGSMLAFLQKVSPALARQVKGAKTTEEALGLMTGAFEKITDPGKRAALAAAAFGKSGLQMGQFLGQGSKAIGEQRAKFFELAGSQQEFVDGAGALDNSMRETETAFLGLRNAAAGALFPALTELAKAISGVLAGNREGLATWARQTGAALGEWVKGGGLKRLTDSLGQLADIAGRLVDGLGGMGNVLAIVGAIMGGKLIVSVGSLCVSMWNLGSAILPIVTRAALLLAPALSSVGAALAPLALAAAPFLAAAAGIAAAGMQIYRYWQPIKELFTDIFAPGGLMATFEEMGKDPLGMLKLLDPRQAFKDFFGADAARPTLGAAGAAPGAGGKSEAHVTLDVNGLPPGSRVTLDPKSTASIDMSRGPAMVLP